MKQIKSISSEPVDDKVESTLYLGEEMYTVFMVVS